MSDDTLTQEEITAIKDMRRSRFRKAHNFVSGVDPWVILVVGLIVLIMWLVCSITQIRTSEALVLGNQKVPMDVTWGVLLQPWHLLTGTAPMEYVMAWSYGWTIEALTLVWGLALEHARVKLLSMNKHIGKWYGLVTFLLIGLNSWADFNSSPGDGLTQVLIAVAVGLMVVTGLPVGLALVKSALAGMSGENNG